MIEEYKRYDDEFGIDTYIKLRRDDFYQQWKQYTDQYSEDYNEDCMYNEIHKLLNEGFPF